MIICAQQERITLQTDAAGVIICEGPGSCDENAVAINWAYVPVLIDALDKAMKARSEETE